MHVGVWLSPADWRLKGDSPIVRYNSDISKTKKCDNKSAGEKKYWLSPAKLIFGRNEDQKRFKQSYYASHFLLSYLY